MKIRLERGDTAFEVERDPMPPERFRTVCAVVLAALASGLCVRQSQLFRLFKRR